MILEKFEKIKNIWPNSVKSLPYGDLSRKELFELAYHASNDVSYRCIHVITKAGKNESGNEAIIYSSHGKKIVSIIGTEEAVNITMYVKDNSEGYERLEEIADILNVHIGDFKKKTENIRNQIAQSILVERKIDEVINLTMGKKNSRKIYFAIGEARERGALIPILMNGRAADVVQLAIMKWMNSALNEPQDEDFPEKKVKGLVKNFIQIKDWLIKLINHFFVTSEEELMKKKDTIAEDES